MCHPLIEFGILLLERIPNAIGNESARNEQVEETALQLPYYNVFRQVPRHKTGAGALPHILHLS